MSEVASASELILPEDEVELQLASNPLLQLESSTYGSAVVYGSAARWVPVYNAQQLQAAVVSGVAHIEIQSHIDLTSLSPPADAKYLFGTVPATVKSITVRSHLAKSVPAVAPLSHGTMFCASFPHQPFLSQYQIVSCGRENSE